MLNPLFNLILALPNGLKPLIDHLDRAHLEESPDQQAADLANVNQYVLTHTVLV
jgi:hypothetical protein